MSQRYINSMESSPCTLNMSHDTHPCPVKVTLQQSNQTLQPFDNQVSPGGGSLLYIWNVGIKNSNEYSIQDMLKMLE